MAIDIHALLEKKPCFKSYVKAEIRLQIFGSL